MIEFRSDYHQQDSAECMERAIDAWNRAPRMANAKAVGLDAAGGQSHTSDGLCPGASSEKEQ